MESKFTDTDLQRLKNHIEEHNEKMEHGGYVDDRGCPFPHHWSDISALLHRLECSEKYIEASVCDTDINTEMWTAWNAWLKSKGESQ